MDLYAYGKIDELQKYLTANHIDIPRLRGLRLMSEEKVIADEEIEKAAKDLGLKCCEFACEGDFIMNAFSFEFSERTGRIKKRYIIYDKENKPVGVKWDKIHGKKRKLFKYEIKQAQKRVYENLTVFNKYCGRSDVLYIHARIGGANWNYYHGDKLRSEPWFLEKVDDFFDTTYCDIYAKISQ